jgi:hypothetical protein
MATGGRIGGQAFESERKKRKPLTKEELAARPAPKKLPKSRKRAGKRASKIIKARMPKEQVARLAAARAKKLKDHEDSKKVAVHLKTFHIFGGDRFGPGLSWVPQCLLLAVLEQDRRAVEVENQLFVERSHLILRSPTGVLDIPIAPQNFQSVWAGENPPIFDQVSGRGVVDGQGPRF